MKIAYSLLIAVALLVACASSLPVENLELDDNSSSSRTWSAFKNFFEPLINYFRKELPDKTPTDFANDVQDVAEDARNWADENKIIQGVVRAFTPVREWFQDQTNNLKDRTFRDMFDDTRQAVSRLDDRVGGWIEDRLE